MTVIEQPDWRALHVFLGTYERADSLIVETLPKALARIPPQDARFDWFFIRYPESGFHVRVRLAHMRDADFRELQAALRAGFPEGMGAESATLPPGGEYPAGTVKEFAYEPETQRYGGPSALAINERLFCVSSRLASQAISATPGDLALRARQAIDFMLGMVAVLHDDPDAVARYFRDYAAYWQNYMQVSSQATTPRPASLRAQPRDIIKRIALLRSSLDSAEASKSLTVHWCRALRDAVAGFHALGVERLLISPKAGAAASTAGETEDAISQMFASQMHMLNNRLGFTPFHEASWSSALASTA